MKSVKRFIYRDIQSVQRGPLEEANKRLITKYNDSDIKRSDIKNAWPFLNPGNLEFSLWRVLLNEIR